MKRFARLYSELDASTATQAKVEALRRYFADAPPEDAAWVVYFLAGGKPRQVVRTAALRAMACELAGLDDWLFEASYQVVGDLAETIALLVPDAPDADHRLAELGLNDWVTQHLLPLRGQSSEAVDLALRKWFCALDASGRFLLIKLVGGGFRVGVSKLLVQRALAEHAGLDPKRVARRMMGYTDAQAVPTAARYLALVAPEGSALDAARDGGQPYPFFLAQPLADAFRLPDDTARWAPLLGEPAAWLVEWKFDGIRGQVLQRAGQVWVWTRGEELVTERYPELVADAAAWPDGTVLDGEILAWDTTADRPAPFARLQQRIGRKTLSRKLLAELPVRFVAYDLLEAEGTDWRERPQWQRRARLEQLAGECPGLRLSPLLSAPDWPALAAERALARERGFEGLMLKQREARYGVGRTRGGGLWCKWKLDPMVVDAVLIYAQAGHGRRAALYTDYTFAVWSRPPASADEAQAVVEAIARREPAQPGALQLVAFAKAYSGLTDAEFAQVDAVIRQTTLEKFGPVRSVRPTLVFELGFEGIGASPRHKSGLAVRFPRLLRLRPDKPLHEANTLTDLRALMVAGQ
ncbi:ATP-dependent DNA ligase [Hydrogenophaga sp. OTU3427]|uniref:ATP-dependent DNA ligase n=1 Tax=Hydrogenophaga sp. OTU3427 TaxID=3043856 RepID=UPI00313D4D80